MLLLFGSLFVVGALMNNVRNDICVAEVLPKEARSIVIIHREVVRTEDAIFCWFE
jgi:hypothetical protein